MDFRIEELSTIIKERDAHQSNAKYLGNVIMDRDEENMVLRGALRKCLDALDTCTPGDYSTGSVCDPYFDERMVDLAINAANTALGDE
jgi:hypothetical protein